MRVPGSLKSCSCFSSAGRLGERAGAVTRRSSADHTARDRREALNAVVPDPAGLKPILPPAPALSPEGLARAAPTLLTPSHSPQATRGSWREPSSVREERAGRPSVSSRRPLKASQVPGRACLLGPLPRPCLAAVSPRTRGRQRQKQEPEQTLCAPEHDQAGSRSSTAGLLAPFRVPAWGRAPVLSEVWLAGDWRCHGNCRRGRELVSQVT